VDRSRKDTAKFCSYRCHAEWQKVHYNRDWLKKGQDAMRQKWQSMTPEERIQNSNIEILKAAAKTKRVRKIFSDTKRGELNPMKRPAVARKVSETIRRKWLPFFSQQMKESWKKGKIPLPWQKRGTLKCPNGQEAILMGILAEEAPTFQWVGNGAFWVGPCVSGKRRNPDFVDRKKKKAILLHGERWHTQESTENDLLDYGSKDWKVLIIWTAELRWKYRDVLLHKIRHFDLSP
jgi:hypothetical protein